MNVALLVKKAILQSLSVEEQIAFVRSANKCLSSLTLILQKSNTAYEDTKKADAALRSIHLNT